MTILSKPRKCALIKLRFLPIETSNRSYSLIINDNHIDVNANSRVTIIRNANGLENAEYDFDTRSIIKNKLGNGLYKLFYTLTKCHCRHVRF